jgi:preprotein translocase subunit YajC
MLTALIQFAQQAGADGAPQGGAPPYFQFVMIGGLVLMFYLLMLRPQQRQERDRLAMISKLKKNNKIVNSGGIIGIIDSIKEGEEEVLLRGGLRITKSSIVRVVADEPAKEAS